MIEQKKSSPASWVVYRAGLYQLSLLIASVACYVTYGKFHFLEILIPRFFFTQIGALLPLQKRYTELKSQFELKSYDLSLFQSRVEQNEHHKVLTYTIKMAALAVSNFKLN